MLPHVFFAFFHKKQRCRLKVTTAWPERKLGGGDAQKLLHTQWLLHREAFTHRRFLHTEGFTRRSLYSKDPKELLHTNVYELLHAEVFTQRCLYTDFFLHTDAFAQKLLHREAFRQRSFYTQKRLHTASFYTHRGFYTEKPLHRGAFYTQKVLHREVFTLRSFCTQTSWSFWTQNLLH